MTLYILLCILPQCAEASLITAMILTMAHKTQEAFDEERMEAEKRVTIGGFYTHYKNPERHYKVLAIGFIEATDEPCVIYESQYGKKFVMVRPLENFLDTIEKDGVRVSRFKKI